MIHLVILNRSSEERPSPTERARDQQRSSVIGETVRPLDKGRCARQRRGRFSNLDCKYTSLPPPPTPHGETEERTGGESLGELERKGGVAKRQLKGQKRRKNEGGGEGEARITGRRQPKRECPDLVGQSSGGGESGSRGQGRTFG